MTTNIGAVAAIILAAGKGTRMRSQRAKVLHELGGEPMIRRAVRAVAAVEPKPYPVVIVVGHQAREVEAAINFHGARFALQEPQRGTGDAVRFGLNKISEDFDGDVLITYGDMPAITSATLRAFLEAHRKSGAKLSFISIVLDDPAAYGRVIRDAAGKVEKIVEHRDASPAERAVKEINTGCYIVDSALLRSALAELKPANAQDEYYLTDLVAIARARDKNEKVEAWVATDPAEFAGVNSREELANMEAEIRAAVNRKLMQSGVTLVDPPTAYISEQA